MIGSVACTQVSTRVCQMTLSSRDLLLMRDHAYKLSEQKEKINPSRLVMLRPKMMWKSKTKMKWRRKNRKLKKILVPLLSQTGETLYFVGHSSKQLPLMRRSKLLKRRKRCHYLLWKCFRKNNNRVQRSHLKLLRRIKFNKEVFHQLTRLIEQIFQSRSPRKFRLNLGRVMWSKNWWKLELRRIRR